MRAIRIALLVFLFYFPPLLWGETWGEWWNRTEETQSSSENSPLSDFETQSESLSGESGQNVESSDEKQPCKGKQLGALAIADWQNTTSIDSFISYTNKYIVNNNQCFVYFNSTHDLTVWMSP